MGPSPRSFAVLQYQHEARCVLVRGPGVARYVPLDRRRDLLDRHAFVTWVAGIEELAEPSIALVGSCGRTGQQLVGNVRLDVLTRDRGNSRERLHVCREEVSEPVGCGMVRSDRRLDLFSARRCRTQEDRKGSGATRLSGAS